MKILITCFFLFSIQIFSQNYLNIHYTNGTDNSIAITSIQKMTLSPSGDQVSIYLTSAPTITENTSDIQRMTFEENPVPVELSSFNASVNGAKVDLQWKTRNRSK